MLCFVAHLNINGMAVFLHCSEELGVIRRLHVIFDDLVLAASPDLNKRFDLLALENMLSSLTRISLDCAALSVARRILQ